MVSDDSDNSSLVGVEEYSPPKEDMQSSNSTDDGTEAISPSTVSVESSHKCGNKTTLEETK